MSGAVIPFPGSPNRRPHERDPDFWQAVETLAYALEGEGLEHGLDWLEAFIREHPEPSETAFEQYAAYHLIRSIVVSRPDPSRAGRDLPPTPSQLARWILDSGKRLSAKEVDFLETLSTWRHERSLTPKQRQWLEDLFVRCGGHPSW